MNLPINFFNIQDYITNIRTQANADWISKDRSSATRKKMQIQYIRGENFFKRLERYKREISTDVGKKKITSKPRFLTGSKDKWPSKFNSKKKSCIAYSELESVLEALSVEKRKSSSLRRSKEKARTVTNNSSPPLNSEYNLSTPELPAQELRPESFPKSDHSYESSNTDSPGDLPRKSDIIIRDRRKLRGRSLSYSSMSPGTPKFGSAYALNSPTFSKPSFTTNNQIAKNSTNPTPSNTTDNNTSTHPIPNPLSIPLWTTIDNYDSHATPRYKINRSSSLDIPSTRTNSFSSSVYSTNMETSRMKLVTKSSFSKPLNITELASNKPSTLMRRRSSLLWNNNDNNNSLSELSILRESHETTIIDSNLLKRDINDPLELVRLQTPKTESKSQISTNNNQHHNPSRSLFSRLGFGESVSASSARMKPNENTESDDRGFLRFDLTKDLDEEKNE